MERYVHLHRDVEAPGIGAVQWVGGGRVSRDCIGRFFELQRRQGATLGKGGGEGIGWLWKKILLRGGLSKVGTKSRETGSHWESTSGFVAHGSTLNYLHIPLYLKLLKHLEHRRDVVLSQERGSDRKKILVFYEPWTALFLHETGWER